MRSQLQRTYLAARMAQVSQSSATMTRPLATLSIFTLLLALEPSRLPDAAADEGRPRLEIEARSVGLGETDAANLTRVLLEHPEARSRFEGHRIRALGFHASGTDPVKERREPGADESYRLTVFDYSTAAAFELIGNLSRMTLDRVTSAQAPNEPSPEELDDAIRILRAHPAFGSGDAIAAWEPYPSMPGILPSERGRVVAIGLMPKAGESFRHEIVGVDLIDGAVIRYPNGAPATALATDRACAPANAGQAVSARGVQGSAVVSVKKDGTELWSFNVVRPSASSGRWGSAIDLREIKYRGKKLLSQIHLPILNVQYARNICGPYRDWQYSEGAFEATGSYLAPGILKATTKPRTIFESGRDLGNYRGVAVYQEGTETVLVTELEAGWYRYKNEYRFDEDGSIRPRWGFSAIQDSCTCNTHNHHAYWRMDFDIGGARTNRIEAFDGVDWVPIARESKQVRGVALQKWRVSNPATGDAYEIVPGEADSTADEYGIADAWLLQFAEGQIDDSSAYRGTWANLDAFVNGQSLDNEDIVFWYGAHFLHVSEPSPTDRSGNHIVGPTIRPIRW